MQGKSEALLAKLHERIAAAPPASTERKRKAAHTLGGMDVVTRESHIRLIGSLRKYYRPYGIELIINQALIGKGRLNDLCDEELVELLRVIDRARECISDGVSFEEAGLIRALHC